MCLLAEGLSAIGALIKVRNPKTTGGYPLRGKPLNVRGMKPLDIVKNKEMFELMSILGLEIGKPAAEIDLYEVMLDDMVYIVGKDDIIIHNDKEIYASTLI
jgi:DNA gyrase/topoisomerase IV subunit B